MQREMNDADTSLAARLDALTAEFGEDVRARWSRLVADAVAAGPDPHDLSDEAHAALIATCENGVHFFAEMLARHGHHGRIVRATSVAIARHTRAPAARVAPEPGRN